METDKILIHYAQFAADMFCNFSGHTNDVCEVVVNDTVHVSFHNSPRYISFECDIKFNCDKTSEEQILQAFDSRYSMILKKIIDECKLMHETYGPPGAEPDTVSKSLVCPHCRVGHKTCLHTCSILSVKRPCDIETQYKLNKEEK